MSVPDEGYSGYASRAPNLISVFAIEGYSGNASPAPNLISVFANSVFAIATRISNLVRATRFRNNLHQVHSYWTPNMMEVLNIIILIFSKDKWRVCL